MKHPVTTTLTPKELENLQKAKGSLSMLQFIRDAITEKCERCLNDGRETPKSERFTRATTQTGNGSDYSSDKILEDIDT